MERVLILADRPILTRPIAAAALPADAMPNAGIARLSAVGAGSEDAVTLQNRHGMRADRPYEVSAQVYRRTLLLNAGFAAWEDEVTPTGSLSLG